ncbi:glycosyltransferase family 4 protein [Halosegnis longus]|uniref:glycosyltransferase family 4 protein n=1 Tax=Halosegnis longus TaxID=2216012 RepID=UPI00129D8CAF|nr:glycosyltransferase family 4 protein [Halosegnis longus]
MEETPNLTYFISGLETGGAEVGMARLLSGLSPEAFDITIVALYGGDKTILPSIPNHVKVIDLDIENKHRIDKLLPITSILRDTDILVGSIYHAEIISRLFGAIFGVDTVLNWSHNTEFKTELRRLVDKVTIGQCDGILADSKAVYSMLIEKQGLDRDRIWTVPIAGLSIEKYTCPSMPLKRLNESVVGGSKLNEVSENAIIIGTVGNLIRPKNHDAIIEVAERFSDKNVHLAIAGDGPRRQELTEIISDRSLTNVSLLGHVNSVPDFLSTVDIYFQPSHYEGLCITVIEAMAAGKPIVASNVGEITINVEHGEQGFVTTPDDIDGFEHHLQQLIDSADLRGQMGRSAHERVRNKYSNEALVDAFCDVINNTYSNDNIREHTHDLENCDAS